MELYMFSFSFRSEEYNCKKIHANIYDSQFKPLHQWIICVTQIDNIADVPICALDYNDKVAKINLKHALQNVFCALFTKEYISPLPSG